MALPLGKCEILPAKLQLGRPFGHKMYKKALVSFDWKQALPVWWTLQNQKPLVFPGVQSFLFQILNTREHHGF
jgi:hypothetical protein